MVAVRKGTSDPVARLTKMRVENASVMPLHFSVAAHWYAADHSLGNPALKDANYCFCLFRKIS